MIRSGGTIPSYRFFATSSGSGNDVYVGLVESDGKKFIAYNALLFSGSSWVRGIEG